MRGCGWEEERQTANGIRPRPANGREVDLKILGLLETWGALGLGQIQTVCSGNRLESARRVQLLFNESVHYPGGIYLRLRKLAARGLVSILRPIHLNQVYILSRKGHDFLKASGAGRLNSALKSPSLGTLEHRLVCAGVGLMASQFLGLTVSSEREFFASLRQNLAGRRPRGFHLPDLVITSSRGRFPVEVELNQKADEDYQGLWDYYRGRLREGDKVVYLVPTPSRAAGLLSLAGDFGADFVFASDLPAWRLSLGRGTFANCRGQGLVLS